MLVAFLALAGLLALVLVFTYNGLVRARIRTQEAWSGIDVQLKRRASLVPNLVATVKEYTVHERGVLEEIARAGGAVNRASNLAEAAAADSTLSHAIGRLFAVAENYPQLRASATFMQLQQELSDLEEKIAYARQFYNRNVADFNTRIETLPDVFLARALGLRPLAFFQAEDAARRLPEVSFAPLPAGPATRKILHWRGSPRG